MKKGYRKRYKNPEAIGKLIREQRRKQKLTKSQLAELTGLSLPTIVKYEYGTVDPYTRNLELIAKALNIDYGELLINDIKRKKRAKKVLLSKNRTAKIIRDKRLDLDLSQGKLAKMTGNNRISISRYETGVHIPSDKNLDQLCKALGLEKDDFYATIYYRED